MGRDCTSFVPGMRMPNKALEASVTQIQAGGLFPLNFMRSMPESRCRSRVTK